jgi:thermostable 8-oxoguanine DNA glycosylase
MQSKNAKEIYFDESQIWRSLKCTLYSFPNAKQELLPGVKWGDYCQLYTPAFWKLQYLISGFSSKSTGHRLCDNIVDEIVMCLLGGYGIPSEMGILAFNRLKLQNLIKSNVSYIKLYNALSKPFKIDNGKEVRYRFYNQKSKYIYTLLQREDILAIPVNDDLELRNWLLTVDGIGLKTASWITRNWLGSNRVAILDIHVLRAGNLTGFFKSSQNVSGDYLELEKSYLSFCYALNVPPADMDAIIWSYMRKTTTLANRSIIQT